VTLETKIFTGVEQRTVLHLDHPAGSFVPNVTLLQYINNTYIKTNQCAKPSETRTKSINCTKRIQINFKEWVSQKKVTF